MPCYQIGNAIITFNKSFRLPLSDGTHVFMEWHDYCGPSFSMTKV